MKHVTTKYKNLMTKEIFLLVTKEIKKKRYTNTKKDTQTHNIKKKKKITKDC